MVKASTASDLSVFPVPRIPDERGNLSFLEGLDHLPFKIGSVAWINDIPSGTSMDGYVNVAGYEVIIALAGSFEVTLNTGTDEYSIMLNRPDMCLRVPSMTWCRMWNFSSNSAVLTIADEMVSTEERVYSFSEFKRMVNEREVYGR